MHKKGAVCIDISMSLMQFLSARAAPTHPHTHLGGVRVRIFSWKCLQEGKTHLEDFSQERLVSLCHWVRLSKGPVFEAVFSLCCSSGK